MSTRTSRIEHMFEIEVDELDADELLTHLGVVRSVVQQAEVRTLEIAAAWADLHGVIACPAPRFTFGEQLVPFGGDGAPDVAEFCPAELGAEMGTSPETAAALIGDALDLRHRLPRLWDRLQSGEVKAWVGRKVATDTRDLTLEAAAVVDRRVAPYSHKLSWGRLAKVVQAAIVDADPDYARQREHARRRDRGVWLRPADETGNVYGSFAAAGPDAARFDAGLNGIADALGVLGDTDPKQVRRAKALGILGNPQQTFALYAAAEEAQQTPAFEPPTSSIEPVATPPLQRPRETSIDPRPKAVLYVHVTDDTLRTGHGVARVEGVGPVTATQAREWLGDCSITVKPVLDLAGIAPVDAYEIPERLREAVHLLTPADVFPYSTNTSRRMDVDHTVAYVSPDDGGPPGQTGIGNLGPMTRRHHRIKTHGGWHVEQPFPGIHVWRSPHGRIYLVDHTGTTRLGTTVAA